MIIYQAHGLQPVVSNAQGIAMATIDEDRSILAMERDATPITRTCLMHIRLYKAKDRIIRVNNRDIFQSILSYQ